MIQHATSRGNVWCRLAVTLRDDDRAILEEIVDLTGIGHLGLVKGVRTSKPQVSWIVQKKGECIELIDLLERFPLRAKKARDFYIWSEAVMLWVNHQPGEDWSPILSLREKLTKGRAYPTNTSKATL